MQTDLNELDTLTVVFHPGRVLFEIFPDQLLSNYSVPTDINAVVLIIKPLNSAFLTLGDIIEAKVIFTGATYVHLHYSYVCNCFHLFTDEITVEWTSSLYRGYENDGFIIAALSISAAFSFSYTITIAPYQLSSDLIPSFATVAFGQY